MLQWRLCWQHKPSRIYLHRFSVVTANRNAAIVRYRPNKGPPKTSWRALFSLYSLAVQRVLQQAVERDARTLHAHAGRIIQNGLFIWMWGGRYCAIRHYLPLLTPAAQILESFAQRFLLSKTRKSAKALDIQCQ